MLPTYIFTAAQKTFPLPPVHCFITNIFFTTFAHSVVTSTPNRFFYFQHNFFLTGYLRQGFNLFLCFNFAQHFFLCRESTSTKTFLQFCQCSIKQSTFTGKSSSLHFAILVEFCVFFLRFQLFRQICYSPVQRILAFFLHQNFFD